MIVRPNRTVSTASPVTTNSNAGVATPIERGSTPLQTTPPPSIARVNNTTAQPQKPASYAKCYPQNVLIRMVADALVYNRNYDNIPKRELQR